MLQHLKVSFRALRKDPSTSIPAVFALALGIGLTTAQFAVTDSMLLRGLPFPDGEEIVFVEHFALADNDDRPFSAHDLELYAGLSGVFETLCAYNHGTVNISDPDERPLRLSGVSICAEFLEVLGVSPLHGRTFIPGVDDASGAERVALLSYSLWQARYGGDLAVLGRQVRTNGELTTVVGILPESFSFPDRQEIWRPLRDPAAEGARGTRSEVYVDAFARLADGVSLDRAIAAMSPITERIVEQNPDSHYGLTPNVEPFTHEYLSAEARGTVATMLVTVFLVLIVACFNVASLLLARASRRSREIAIRTAMGASRRRAIGLLLTESIALSAVGAVCSIPVALWGIDYFDRGLHDMGGPPPFWLNVQLDARTLLFCAGVSILAGLIAGLLPALRASRANVSEVLQDSARGASSLRIGRLSRGLVLAEIALSCALLVAAGVLIQNLRSLDDNVLTFDPADLLTFRVGLFENSYPEATDQLRFFEELEAEFRARADVQDAATAISLPADGRGYLGSKIALEGNTYERESDRPGAQVTVISPNYLDLLGISILEGRGFNRSDREDHRPVALISETFAREQFGAEGPLGRRLQVDTLDDEEKVWRTVVGVVPDLVGEDLDQDFVDAVYVPMAQSPVTFSFVVVRPAATADLLAFTETARRIVEAKDADTPIYWVRSLEQVVQENRVVHQLISGTFTIFGVASLLLTVVGLYGVMAFSVSQRTQEIGVRMAFGARSRDVLTLITGQGLRQVAFGLTLGILLAIPLTQALSSFVYGAEAGASVRIFAAVAGAFLLIAAIACFLPARRAARVDPIQALQHD
ncbi:MAG: ABC transporter permease [Acidobacteriota bacterium]